MLDVDSRGLEAFKGLADSLEELVFVWKPNGDLLWMNQAFMRESGKALSEIGLQDPDEVFVHPDDLELVLNALGSFLDSEDLRSQPIVHRFIDRSGRVHGLSSIAHKVRWSGEPALLVVSTLADQATSGEPDPGYRRLVESAEDSILKLDANGYMIYANRRFLDMCGLELEELATRRLPELLQDEDRAAAERALEQLRGGSPCVSFEARLTRTGGQRSLDVKVCRVENGQNATFLGIARDVSHTRMLEERMRKGQKLESLGTMAGGLAHDFNNIVTSVLANATLAENMLAGASQTVLEVLEDIRVSAERAARLNASLLTYVGQAPTRLEVIDLHECARQTLRLLGPSLNRAVRIELSAAGEPPLVRADPSQIAQAMVNLITNAAEAVPESGGRVMVETGVAHYLSAPGRTWMPSALPPGRYAFLRVIDDGQGISPRVLERIFDPFFSTKATGRGLGLSATLGTVRRHAGALCLDSQPGRGTRVEVVLPLAERAAEPQEARETGPRSRAAPSTGVVLFCDDERLIRQLGKRILEREGYEVVLASTGEEALEKLAADRERFSVLVVDHILPGLRGDKVALRARELRPDLAIVKASGYRDAFDEAEVGGSVFLPKPYTRAALIDSVHAAVRAAPH